MQPLTITPSARKHAIGMTSFTIVISVIAATYFVLAPPQLPLLYSLALPSQQVVAKTWLFLLPSLSLAASLIHTVIINQLSRYSRTIQTLFSWSGWVFQILLVLALLRIVLITH